MDRVDNLNPKERSMNKQEFLDKIRAIAPNATLETDTNEEIIVRTGLIERTELVTISGLTTTTEQDSEPMFDFGSGPVPAHQHPIGGGWVADTAYVASTAYVGPNARVFGDARVYGNARVFGDAQVYGN